MKIAIGILVGLIVAVAAIHIMAPKEFAIEREIVINKPQSVVFENIKFLKNHRAWNPWIKRDLNIKFGELGVDGTVGFIASWEGNAEVGIGEQEIKSITEGQRIDTELRFKKPLEGISKGYFATEAVGEKQTKVKWGMNGQNKFPGTIISVLFQMNKRMDTDFDRGLSELKTILEK